MTTDNTADNDESEASLPCEGKLVFGTRSEAQAAATVAGYRYGSSLRPYVCRHCGLWHLATHHED